MAENNILVFMAGDNNLDISGVQNIKDMLAAPASPDVNLIIQFDRRRPMPWEDAKTMTTKRLQVANNKLIELQDLGETDTGDPAVLNDFVRWGTQTFPSPRTLLVIWNHGGGAKDVNPYKDVSTIPRRAIFATAAERTSAFDPTRIGAIEKLICVDDSSRDFLDNIELKRAVTIPGVHYDILAFDACMMNMLEVAYQVKDTAEIIIGSEEIEPATGWPYKTILEQLTANATIDSNTLANEVVADYGAFYADGSELATQSALSANALPAVAKALEELSVELLAVLTAQRGALASILNGAQRFHDGDYVDLYDLAVLVKNNLSDTTAAAKAAGLITALGAAIIANAHVGDKVANAHGVSVYFPLTSPSDEVLSIYRTLDFTLTFPHYLELVLAFTAGGGLRR